METRWCWYLNWRAGRRESREAHDIGEEDGHHVKGLGSHGDPLHQLRGDGTGEPQNQNLPRLAMFKMDLKP